VSKFENIVKQFADLTERQHSIYENTLKQISENFINQIALSNEWHKTHNDRLDRMEKNIDIIVKK
jgi:oligoendopeptidase F